MASCPVTGHHWNEPGSILFSLSLQNFIHWWDLPEPSLGQTVQTHSASHCMKKRSSAFTFFGACTGCSPICPYLSCTRKPRTAHSIPGVASPQGHFAGSCSAHCPPKSPLHFLQCSLQVADLQSAGSWGHYSPAAGIGIVLLWTRNILLCPLFILLRSPQMAAQQPRISNTPPGFVLSGNLLRVCNRVTEQRHWTMLNPVSVPRVHHWPPTGPNAADHNPLNLAAQPAFSLFHCPSIKVMSPHPPSQPFHHRGYQVG